MTMSLLSDPRLHELLERIDRELAQEVQSQGCPQCGGRLHGAAYPRFARGVPANMRGEPLRRLSFCCDREGCRRRATPASVRFLGRRTYLSAVVVLVSAMHHGLTGDRYGKLRALLGVGRRTVQRWRRWWHDTFARSSFWHIERATFMPPPRHEGLPRELLESFRSDDAMTRLVALLRCIAPITVPSEHDLRRPIRSRRG